MSKVALLIGVSEYQPELNSLPAAVKDVEAMRRVLVNPEMGGFADADVTVLKNPQPDDIRYAIYELFTNRQKDDLLLFYFSGHGIKDDKGNLYFATRDTRKDNGKLVKPSAVAARTLHENINDSRSQRQIIILDCCFSGAIAKGMSVKDDGSVNVEEQLGGKGRAILTSSTSTQYSFEQQDSELSIYTRYLVEGVNTGVADKDGDGWISIDELHEYASSKVQETSPAMTPEFYPVKEGHKILLAKSPKDDPKLVYRQEVESRAQESQGAFSIFALRILEGKRQELNISPEEANVIKEEVLQPYREYERKRYEYEQTLIEAVKKHYPFSQVIQKEIKEYQQYLGLRDEDIAAIEQRVFAPKQAEYERQQEEERLKREQERVEYQEQLRQQEQQVQQRLQREQEDVAQIKKPILDEKEIEEQEKLQRRRRQQYENEPQSTQRQQYQENLRQKHKLRQQQQDNKQQQQQEVQQKPQREQKEAKQYPKINNSYHLNVYSTNNWKRFIKFGLYFITGCLTCYLLYLLQLGSLGELVFGIWAVAAVVLGIFGWVVLVLYLLRLLNGSRE